MNSQEEIRYQEIWDAVLKLIKESKLYDDAIYTTYIEPTKLFRMNGDVALVTVPNNVSSSIISGSLEQWKRSLSQIADGEYTIQLILHKDVEKIMPNVMIKKQTDSLFEQRFNKLYTFDNFVVGKSNREAYAASIACCNYPGQFNNPLMIYGNSGLGKTHLLHAIGNYLKENQPEAKVIYIYSEDIVTLLIEAMKNKNVQGNSVEDIKARFMECDFLLIDDIQRMKQSASQEIFFNLYNKLIAENKQIIITSDIHPSELKGIENRLISRFLSGLKVRVGSPEFETAKAILKKKIEGRNESIMIEDEVLDFIATKFSSDVRKLEGSLNELFFKAILENPGIIDLKFAQSVFSNEPVTVVDEDLSIGKIKTCVCEYYGLTKNQIESKSRTKQISNARHIAVYICRKHLQVPFVKIGFSFGNRDHSTIMSSYEKAKKMIKQDPLFKTAVEQIEAKLGVH
ncbi:chromosomal replication initiator protein DnaA [Merdibacter massiliensis]|uniref:chromosomal replication initiator protein DnaA n=1 Tax=Merdibacter massiliensis TaxID=1871030 RepID=UPI00096A5651|nr:chromosomal replication initiator protein DnaA [Merdibacter massiliensis]